MSNSKRPERKSGSHLISILIALVVLYYVLELSRGDRGGLDFAVIAVVGGAILWNLFQALRKLRPKPGQGPD